jgi:hypothetical protein
MTLRPTVPAMKIAILSAPLLAALLTACTPLEKRGAAPTPVTAAAAKPPTAPTTPLGSITGAPSSAANPSAAANASVMMGGPPPAPGEPRRYADVVTKDAITARGMVLHHKIRDRHLFEIPEKLLGKDLLWSVEISQASAGGGFNGLPLGYRVLRFERVENRILMRSVSYDNRAIGDIKAAVEAVDLAPIVMSFPVEAEGSERSLDIRQDEKDRLAREQREKEARDRIARGEPAEPPAEPKPAVDTPPASAPITAADATKRTEQHKAEAKAEAKADSKTDSKPAPEPRRAPPKEKWPVIDVTRLLMTTSSDLIDARNLGPMGFGGVDPSRSAISSVKVFQGNVEARATLTFSSFAMPMMNQQGMPQMPTVSRNPTRTAVVHYSLAKLPDEPMRGRYGDDRVGYFAQGFTEYGGVRTGTREREFIRRFRLEKKVPGDAVSEPVKPITIYIAQEVPEKWRTPMMQGVEDWNQAFETAGFKNALVAKMAPTKQEDPLWDPEDARYSVIRWVAMPVANAMGPHVHDPRSGEVISAHIIFWHDLLKFMEQLYFVQAGAADPRVKNLPLPDEVMGELIRSVTTHEVGHTLGLRHNHRAATAYSVKELRNPAFANANGTSASVMSYARFNSVAQPGDGVTSFVPKIGPYDLFAIEWGYKPLDTKTAEDEIPILDRMAARHLNEPLLKFGGEDLAAFLDPEVLTENIGKERIPATRLSLASLERSSTRLLEATTRLGEDYETLERTYTRLLAQRSQYISSVVKMIGGVRETRYLGGRGGDTFSRTTPKEQREAIRFLLDEALSTPRWLIDPKVLNRIAMVDVTAPVVNAQKRILAEMLQPVRFRVLEDVESLAPGTGLTAYAYLDLVQRSVFRETRDANLKVDIYRRELQREYVEHLKTFSGEAQRFRNFGFAIAAAQTELLVDLRPAAMQSLKDVKQMLTDAANKPGDPVTRQHFAQLARDIEKTLRIRGS